MKTFDFDWTRFLQYLPAWERLPRECREFFAFHAKTNRRKALGSIEIDVTPLIDEGFLEYAKDAAYVKMCRPRLPFQRVVHAMSRHRIFGPREAAPKDLQAYFGQCRTVDVSSTVLIRCPDRETALKVRSVGGRKLRPLTDTILELADGSYQRTLERKLRQNGIDV